MALQQLETLFNREWSCEGVMDGGPSESLLGQPIEKLLQIFTGSIPSGQNILRLRIQQGLGLGYGILDPNSEAKDQLEQLESESVAQAPAGRELPGTVSHRPDTTGLGAPHVIDDLDDRPGRGGGAEMELLLVQPRHRGEECLLGAFEILVQGPSSGDHHLRLLTFVRRTGSEE